jgi:hypothetical protein
VTCCVSLDGSTKWMFTRESGAMPLCAQRLLCLPCARSGGCGDLSKGYLIVCLPNRDSRRTIFAELSLTNLLIVLESIVDEVVSRAAEPDKSWVTDVTKDTWNGLFSRGLCKECSFWVSGACDECGKRCSGVRRFYEQNWFRGVKELRYAPWFFGVTDGAETSHAVRWLSCAYGRPFDYVNTSLRSGYICGH